jgi:hypothetical protein
MREQYETNIVELAKYVKENNPGCLEYRWKKLPLRGRYADIRVV